MSFEFVNWRDEPDEHELLRLELVGLAAEIATLSTRIEETLCEMPESEALPFKSKRESLVSRALSVLVTETTFDKLSIETLRGAIDILCEDREQMLDVRREVDSLVDRWRLP